MAEKHALASLANCPQRGYDHRRLSTAQRRLDVLAHPTWLAWTKNIENESAHRRRPGIPQRNEPADVRPRTEIKGATDGCQRGRLGRGQCADHGVLVVSVFGLHERPDRGGDCARIIARKRR